MTQLVKILIRSGVDGHVCPYQTDKLLIETHTNQPPVYGQVLTISLNNPDNEDVEVGVKKYVVTDTHEHHMDDSPFGPRQHFIYVEPQLEQSLI